MPSGAPNRALRLELDFEQKLEELRLPSFRECEAQVRVYLGKQNSELRMTNNIHSILWIPQSAFAGLPEDFSRPLPLRRHLRGQSPA